ncbi:hypothetical protein TUMEXPCC7403_12480 [Tumidithrix helvetica PCC 7403]|uniref:hypothetical protein n=1 Tax=Tumidithrix helvetica TaxID=3457545 RepID=UPI003CB737B8
MHDDELSKAKRRVTRLETHLDSLNDLEQEQRKPMIQKSSPLVKFLLLVGIGIATVWFVQQLITYVLGTAIILTVLVLKALPLFVIGFVLYLLIKK